jgi:hypothetical protein
MLFFLILESILISTLLYYYLHYKTRISLKYLGQDNVVVIVLAFLLSWWIATLLPLEYV